MKIVKDILVFVFVVSVIALLIWAVFSPLPTYIGTYCNPQNQCRYEAFQGGCPDTDSENVVIGDIDQLKPNTCKVENE